MDKSPPATLTLGGVGCDGRAAIPVFFLGPRGLFFLFQHGGARVRALEVKLAAQIEERDAAKQARNIFSHFPCGRGVCHSLNH